MVAERHLKEWMTTSLAVLGVLCAQVLAFGFAGGTGEPNNPYQIVTADQLVSIGSDPNLLNKCYELMADIDLSGVFLLHAPIAFDTDATTAGFQGHPSPEHSRATATRSTT